jgi:hypothetical protein
VLPGGTTGERKPSEIGAGHQDDHGDDSEQQQKRLAVIIAIDLQARVARLNANAGRFHDGGSVASEDDREGRLQLRVGYAGTQARHGPHKPVEGIGDRTKQKLRMGGHGDVEVRDFTGDHSGKIARGNSDDCEGIGVEGKDLADNGGVEREVMLPPVVGNEHRTGGSGEIFLGIQGTTENRMDGQRREKIIGDHHTFGREGIVFDARGDVLKGLKAKDVRKFAGLLAETEERGMGERVRGDAVAIGDAQFGHRGHVYVGAGPGEHAEFLRVGNGKRAKEDGIDQREDGGARSDAEGEREDGDGSEARALAQLPKTIATIGDHGLQPVANPFFVDLVFHLSDPSEFDPRSPLGFVQGHASAEVFVGEHFDVGMNLLVEVFIMCMFKGLAGWVELRPLHEENPRPTRNTGYSWIGASVWAPGAGITACLRHASQRYIADFAVK